MFQVSKSILYTVARYLWYRLEESTGRSRPHQARVSHGNQGYNRSREQNFEENSRRHTDSQII